MEPVATNNKTANIDVTIHMEPVATNSKTSKTANMVEAVAEVVAVDEVHASLTAKACGILNVKDVNTELKKLCIAKKGKLRKIDILALLKDAIRNNVFIYDENKSDKVEGERVQASSIEDGFFHSA